MELKKTVSSTTSRLAEAKKAEEISNRNPYLATSKKLKDKACELLMHGLSEKDTSLALGMNAATLTRYFQIHSRLNELLKILGAQDFNEVTEEEFLEANKLLKYKPIRWRKAKGQSDVPPCGCAYSNAQEFLTIGNDLYRARAAYTAAALDVVVKAAKGGEEIQEINEEFTPISLKDPDTKQTLLTPDGTPQTIEVLTKRTIRTKKLAPQWLAAAWFLERRERYTSSKENVRNGLTEELWEERKDILQDTDLTPLQKAYRFEALGIPIPEIIMLEIKHEFQKQEKEEGIEILPWLD